MVQIFPSQQFPLLKERHPTLVSLKRMTRDLLHHLQKNQKVLNCLTNGKAIQVLICRMPANTGSPQWAFIFSTGTLCSNYLKTNSRKEQTSEKRSFPSPLINIKYQASSMKVTGQTSETSIHSSKPTSALQKIFPTLISSTTHEAYIPAHVCCLLQRSAVQPWNIR